MLKAPHRCAGAGSLGLCTVQHEQMQELLLVTAYFGLVTVQHEQHVPELPCITERTTFSFTVLGTDKLPCYMPPPALCTPVALANHYFHAACIRNRSSITKSIYA